MRANIVLPLFIVVLSIGCGSAPAKNKSGSGYEEYECPSPIGKIVREDCSRVALQYEGASFGGSVGVGGVGASASYRESAIREADALVALLKEQRVALCNNFNTCKLSLSEYREDQKRIDDSFVALMALKDRMAAMDADGATKLLAEIQAIRGGHRSDAAPVAKSPGVGLVAGARYALRNKNSDLCVAVAAGYKEDGGEVIQWDCHHGPDERWQLTSQPNGAFMLVNKNSSRCMAVGGGVATNGGKVIQWNCHGGPDEIWTPEAEGDGWFRLVNRNSGRCLAVPSARKEQGIRLIQWDCYGGAEQSWRAVTLD